MILNPYHYKRINEIIAEYMQLEKDENDKWISPINGSKIVNLKYHESWEWIMSVVEKIITHYCIITIDGAVQITSAYDNSFNYISESESSTLLNVYNACYQFIKNLNNE